MENKKLSETFLDKKLYFDSDRHTHVADLENIYTLIEIIDLEYKIIIAGIGDQYDEEEVNKLKVELNNLGKKHNIEST